MVPGRLSPRLFGPCVKAALQGPEDSAGPCLLRSWLQGPTVSGFITNSTPLSCFRVAGEEPERSDSYSPGILGIFDPDALPGCRRNECSGVSSHIGVWAEFSLRRCSTGAQQGIPRLRGKSNLGSDGVGEVSPGFHLSLFPTKSGPKCTPKGQARAQPRPPGEPALPNAGRWA